jgi:hypothetical protein
MMTDKEFEAAANRMMWILLFGGTVVTIVGVYMWQGAWAALAAFGMIVTLLAMSQQMRVSIANPETR